MNRKKNKIAVLIFHKNVTSYPKEWINKCMQSIRQQTFQEFDVYEIDYGNDHNQIYVGSDYENMFLNNHAEAHNYLLDKIFFTSKRYEYAFNVNIDDHYSLDRFEKQLEYARKGYDVVSSNFYNIDENDNIIKGMVMHNLNIEHEASRNHNIIAHPVLCYSRKFWLTCSKLNGEEIPRDDFELWKRSFGKYTFVIVPEFLLYYRVHSQKVCNQQ